MSWTTDYPTKPGFYWIRNYRNIYGESHEDPAVVEVDNDGDFYWTGSEVTGWKYQVASAEWQGPIEPKRENVNRPTFKRALPEMACASCAKIATEYISWPTHKIDKDQYFSLICRKCWIERLTPEQREAYRV